MDAERIAKIKARVDAATDGPWAFGTAPAEGSDESKAEYLSRALTDAGPLYALWVPASVGHPDGHLVPAVTGDGPNAGNNAKFIAHARTDVPDLLAEVERLTDERDALAATVERVRGLHTPAPVYLLADECGHEDCDLIESYNGPLCGDSPTGEQFCEACTHDEDDELTPWPCPTVRALDGEVG